MKPGTKSFSTRHGYCQIHPDHLEIVREDPYGRMIWWLFRKGISRVLWFYLLFSLGLVLVALMSVQINNYFLATFFALFSLMALWASWHNRFVSFATYIPRKQIEGVSYQEAVQGESRATFLIHFRPRKRLLKRRLTMPSLSQGGSRIAQSAYYMLKEEGLIERE